MKFESAQSAYEDTTSAMRFLYEKRFGRMILKIATAPWISKTVGWFLNTPLSKPLIGRFIKNNGIDMSEYELSADQFKCFNEFFYRRIRSDARPVAQGDWMSSVFPLVSPADSRLSAYPIAEDSVFTVKNTKYSLTSLLRNEQLANEFIGGTCLIFRLTVKDYHRYTVPDNCTVSSDGYHLIPGRLHTVNPIANCHVRTFIENSREYAVLHTEHFGDVIQMEVGALMVGKIVNERNDENNDENSGENGSENSSALGFKAGQEKGHFEFGGSTIILLLKENAAAFDKRLFELSAEEKEIHVNYGEKINI